MTPEEEAEHWERLLASEGMPAEIPPRYIRATTPDADGLRPRNGPREVTAQATDDRRQTPINLPRAQNATEALMVEPFQPVDAYPTDRLQHLREALLDAMETLLTPAQLELVTAAVLGDETYADVGARLGMPHSTAWYTTARALRILRDGLTDVPEVAAYLARHEME